MAWRRSRAARRRTAVWSPACATCSSEPDLTSAVIAAFFDVDRTLVPGTSLEQLFVIWLFRRGHLGPLDAVRVALGVAPLLREARRRGYLEYHAYLAGRSEGEVRCWAAQCFEEWIRPRVSSQGAARLAEHRTAGHLTVLLSGSIQPLVDRLGLWVEADLAVGTELETRHDRYTGHVAGRHIAADQKVVRVLELARQHGFDLANSFCYADHRTDVAMLERFGHPMPTNPDPTLARIARERGWSICRFG